MTQPRITVITPCLNQADFVERTMCSVLDQGYQNLEYMVVDGGSTDGSVDLIRLYADHLAWWCSESDHGPADAINKALARTTGDIVAILDADDLYLPGALDKVAAEFQTPGVPAWVVGRCLRVGETDQMLGRIDSEAPPSLALFLMHNSGALPRAASFFRRAVFRDFGGLDDALRYAFDYDYYCRLLAGGRQPVVLADTLAAHREHAASRTAMQPIQAGLEYIAAARHYADHLPMTERCALWVNCDYRERIFALAQAEACGPAARRFLLQQLVRHPWWLAHTPLRHALVRGAAHPISSPTVHRSLPRAA